MENNVHVSKFYLSGVQNDAVHQLHFRLTHPNGLQLIRTSSSAKFSHTSSTTFQAPNTKITPTYLRIQHTPHPHSNVSLFFNITIACSVNFLSLTPTTPFTPIPPFCAPLLRPPPTKQLNSVVVHHFPSFPLLL